MCLAILNQVNSNTGKCWFYKKLLRFVNKLLCSFKTEMKNHIDCSPLYKNINLDSAHNVKQVIYVESNTIILGTKKSSNNVITGLL